MTRRIVLAVLAVSAACGGGPAPRRPGTTPDPFTIKYEHWEDVGEQRLVYSDKCGMGPFEVVLPEREADPRFTYGRRMVLLVYGPRTLELQNELRAEMQTGFHVSGKEKEAEHLECRAGKPGDSAVGKVSVPAVPARTTTTTKPPGGAPVPEKHWYVIPPSAQLPQLVPYDGPMRELPRQGGAIAIYPQGDPYYYADDLWSATHEGSAAPRMELRFWTPSPSNLEGIVFKVIEQRLVPDHDTPTYASEFAARVARVKQREADERPARQEKYAQHAKHCKLWPSSTECAGEHWVHRMPPAPLVERRPKAPSNGVDWVPGYWIWDDAIEDFAWISGTYVVRLPKPATSQPVEPSPPPSVAITVEPPREIDVKIAEPPAPRVEVIAPPPPPAVAQPNTIWVGGHWELAGTSWRWIAGAWRQGPAGSLYRAPSVRTKGKIRIYIPGGWRRR